MMRLVLLLAVLLLMIGFAFKNAEQAVTLNYFFGWSSAPLPVYQLVLGAAFAGGLVVIVLLLPEWVRLRLEMRKQRKALEQTEKALKRLQPVESDDSGEEIP